MKRLVVVLVVGVLAACSAPTSVRVTDAPVVVAAAGDISCPALARVRPVACQQSAVAAQVADAGAHLQNAPSVDAKTEVR